MSIETKQLHSLSKIYKEAVYGGAKKEAPKDTRLVVTAADKKANTKAYQNYKAGNKAYKAADHLKDEVEYATEAKKEPRWQDDDCDDKWYEKSDVDGKISKREKKAKEKAYAKESYSDWRQDLKEIPDYDQIPVDSKKGNEKISEKKVKNSVKINPTMEEEFNIIIEEYADELSESDIADILARLEKKRISKGGDPDESPLGKKTGRAMKSQQDKARKKAGLKTEDVEIVDEKVATGPRLGEPRKKGATHMNAGEGEKIQKRTKEWMRKQNPPIEGAPGGDAMKAREAEHRERQAAARARRGVKEEVVDEGVYEKQKTKEVMGALKKRDLKTSVKKKIAADIVKKKGDTSKSDDRYAYEDHVWDKVADMLTELGKLNDVQFRVEGYQRNPEKGEKEDRKYEKVRGERTPMPPRGNKRREEFERWYAANVR